MKLEGAKGFVPLLVAAPFHALVHPLPSPFIYALFGVAAAWAVFVMFHAGAASFGLNKRHEAYMKAAGVNTDLRSILGDKRLWRKYRNGMTMREFVAERKRPPGPTESV